MIFGGYLIVRKIFCLFFIWSLFIVLVIDKFSLLHFTINLHTSFLANAALPSFTASLGRCPYINTCEPLPRQFSAIHSRLSCSKARTFYAGIVQLGLNITGLICSLKEQGSLTCSRQTCLMCSTSFLRKYCVQIISNCYSIRSMCLLS